MYRVEVPPERRTQVESAVAELLAQESYLVERGKGKKTLQLMADLQELRLDDDATRALLAMVSVVRDPGLAQDLAAEAAGPVAKAPPDDLAIGHRRTAARRVLSVRCLLDFA